MDPKRVKADRLEDVLAEQALVPSLDIDTDEGEAIADVEPLRGGIGEHHQGVERILRRIEIGRVQSILIPMLLPTSLDLVVVVAARHRSLRLF